METRASLIISPVDWAIPKILDNPKTNEDLLLKTSKSSRLEAVHSWNNGDLQLVADGQKLLLLDLDKMQVRYFVQYEFGSFRGVKTITQIALWAKNGFPMPSVSGTRVINWTFFEYLLPKADAIAADSLQTAAGMNFWLQRIADALSRGYRALAVIRDLNKIVEIESTGDLVNLSGLVWGRNAHHEHRRAFITQKPIFPDAVPSSQYLASVKKD